MMDFNGDRSLDGFSRFLDSGGEDGRGPTEEEVCITYWFVIGAQATVQ